MTIRTYLAIFAVSIPLVSCINLPSHAEADGASVSDEALLSTDGIWQSDGFGYLMKIDDDAVRFFHSTPDICIETDNEGMQLVDVFDVHRFSDAQTMHLSTRTEPFEFVFHKIAQLPANCSDENDGTIARTAVAVISFFSEHYVFFEERGLDWPQMIVDFQQDVAGQHDERAFYASLTDMLSLTKDAHVELSATIDEEAFRFDADPGLIRRLVKLRALTSNRSEKEEREAFLQDFWADGIGEGILNGQSRSGANDRIRYGMIDDKIGYIAVRSMGGYVTEDLADGETEEAVLSNIMDRAIADFDQARARAVILDISINSGGYGYLSRQLAGRFFDTRTNVYGVSAGDAQDQSTQAVFVSPEGRSQFVGPVYILTSSETVSAAESLTMAMRARPFAVHAGAATRGALSTKLAKLLPNGWELMLSNQVVLDHEGVQWEANAPAPDLAIRVFPDRNIEDAGLLDVDFAAAHQSAVGKLVAHMRATLEAE